MARRPSPFPFPVPDPPRAELRSPPFPPPVFPAADETANVLARRLAGVPLPLFFAIGAVVGIVLAVTVVSLVRRSSPSSKGTTKAVSAQVVPVVEHAHALFVWPPAIAGERAHSAHEADEVVEIDAVARPVVAAPVARPAPARIAMSPPRAAQPAKPMRAEKSQPALPANLLSAGL